MKLFQNRKRIFSIRKFKIGVASVAIGISSILPGFTPVNTVHAATGWEAIQKIQQLHGSIVDVEIPFAKNSTPSNLSLITNMQAEINEYDQKNLLMYDYWEEYDAEVKKAKLFFPKLQQDKQINDALKQSAEADDQLARQIYNSKQWHFQSVTDQERQEAISQLTAILQKYRVPNTAYKKNYLDGKKIYDDILVFKGYLQERDTPRENQLNYAALDQALTELTAELNQVVDLSNKTDDMRQAYEAAKANATQVKATAEGVKASAVAQSELVTEADKVMQAMNTLREKRLALVVKQAPKDNDGVLTPKDDNRTPSTSQSNGQSSRNKQVLPQTGTVNYSFLPLVAIAMMASAGLVVVKVEDKKRK